MLYGRTLVLETTLNEVTISVVGAMGGTISAALGGVMASTAVVSASTSILSSASTQSSMLQSGYHIQVRAAFAMYCVWKPSLVLVFRWLSAIGKLH